MLLSQLHQLRCDGAHLFVELGVKILNLAVVIIVAISQRVDFLGKFGNNLGQCAVIILVFVALVFLCFPPMEMRYVFAMFLGRRIGATHCIPNC